MQTSIYNILFTILFVLFINGNIQAQELQYDVQIYSMQNKDKKITPKSIEDNFNSLGLSVIGNNNMNRPFRQRFKKIHFDTYNLAMYMNKDLTFKLLQKYPQFGLLSPFTMSIWQDKNNNINISTLTIDAISRTTNIPKDDPDLIAYSTLIKQALKKSLPQGNFTYIPAAETKQNNSFQINFTHKVDLSADEDLEDYVDDFEEEFEAEMESLGFLFPNITNIQGEIFSKHNYHQYDFYHTYSICKFDVIFPVSKLHPEAGAWAPCSFYIYKKKNEDIIHMGFLGVDNWITSLNITDSNSIKPLQEAQSMIKKIIKDITE